MLPRQPENSIPQPPERRHLISTAGPGTAALAAGLGIARTAHAAGSDVVRLGLIGCGNRGTGACREALLTEGPKRLVAIGDLFPERIEFSLKNLLKYDDIHSSIDVPDDRRFVGFDAYQRVIDAGVDLVLLATPPHFRPIHYAAAIQAGKHAFLEKPICVDAPGYRQLLAANAEAKRQKLSVVVGLQRRHQRNYLEGVQKIRDGAIGDVTYIRTYFNVPAGGRSGMLRPAGMSELEYQIRHWGVFLWLCGDHLVEQATHQVDVANWVLNAHPVRASGLGGREVRRGPGNGDIWDHHTIEFEYEGGARYFCQARQQAGTWDHVSESVHGTKGMLVLGTGPWGFGDLTPRDLRDKKRVVENPYRREHDNLFASIRGTGPYRLDAEYGATSSMTAVMGRMATYSGRLITWDEAVQSELRLGPDRYTWDADPPVKADASGAYAAAVPGETRVL
jgi:myo-inositol 2-dehydrogenase / D-chiro-inositol 1-dehydrogenase